MIVNISNANMDEGSLRVDVNVSMEKHQHQKVELKNLYWCYLW